MFRRTLFSDIGHLTDTFSHFKKGTFIKKYDFGLGPSKQLAIVNNSLKARFAVILAIHCPF